MKRLGTLALCAAGGLVLAADVRAVGNPYEAIVVRNVFDVHPPPPPPPAEEVGPPPPKITPNGIMSIFGHLQVLFKANVPARPGQPAKEQSYILSEGQGQDDIEVLKIDEKAGMVTFNNHGVTQDLPLTAAPASGPAPAARGPEPSAAPRGFVPPTARFGGANSGGGGASITTIGNRGGGGGRSLGVASGGNDFNNNAGGQNFGGGVPPAGGFTGQPVQNMSSDQQTVMILANHLKAQQEGDPSAAIFPPTEFDKEAGINPNTAAPPTPPGSTSTQH